MKSRKKLLKYWSNAGGVNDPYLYLQGWDQTYYLCDVMKEYINKNDRILEIGCNVGRNLYGLYLHGYKKLTGIELNQKALDIMKWCYPYMYKNIHIIQGGIEYFLPRFKGNQIDCIYTMAVLEHVHPDIETEVFKNIIRVANKNIITIEDEYKTSSRHKARRYNKIFNNTKFKELHSEAVPSLSGLKSNYKLRIFERI